MWHAWQSEIAVAVTFLSALVLLAAAIHDLIARTAPNWMALLLFLFGLALRLIEGQLLAGLIAAAVVFFVAVFCWRRGWMGGGDVKLIGATALVVPPVDVTSFVVSMTLAGSILALVYIAARRTVAAPAAGRPRTFLARAMRAERWRIQRGSSLPYACAIAAGFLFINL